MAETAREERSREYMEAIRHRVCSVCLDSRDDASCGLTGRLCAIEKHLPRLVAVLSSIDSPRIDDYAEAVRAQVCPSCDSQDADQHCSLREQAACSLDAYLSLVVDAVEEVNARRGSRG